MDAILIPVHANGPEGIQDFGAKIQQVVGRDDCILINASITQCPEALLLDLGMVIQVPARIRLTVGPTMQWPG